MNSSFSFIFLGDTHGFIDDFSKQKEIIEKINPDIVLSETMQEIVLDSKEKYLEILNKKYISEMTKFGEVENIINFCFKKNIKLIGIDLKNFGFSKNLQEKITTNKEISKIEEEQINKILKKRAKYQLERIKKYKDESQKPILIIIGAWHLRENSLLMKSLDNYKVIFPGDKNGNLLIEPPKNKEDVIFYERIKCLKN